MKTKTNSFNQEIGEVIKDFLETGKISFPKTLYENTEQLIKRHKINKTMKGVQKFSDLWIAQLCDNGLSVSSRKILVNIVVKELRFRVSVNRFAEVRKWIDTSNLAEVYPELFAKHQTAFYGHAMYCYKTDKGKPDWGFVAMKLGIQDRFSVETCQSYMGDKQKIIKFLLKVLQENQPAQFNPDWIGKNGKGIRAQIEKYFRTSHETVDWESVIKLLPQKWQKRWTIESHRKELATSLTTIVTAIESRIISEQIMNFSPKWIQVNLPKDYKILSRRLIGREGGGMRWHILYDLFSETVRKRWKQHKIYLKEKLPDHFYENQKEVDEILNNYHNDLLLLYHEGRIKYDNIFVTEMIYLAQKGNKSALNCLTDHVESRVQWLVGHRKDLAPWQFAADEMRETITKCIIKCENKKKFFPYLLVTLQRSAPRFREKRSYTTTQLLT